MTQVRSTFGAKPYHEGYVYNSYGDEKYLKHVIASIETLRRYDSHRPVALFCSAAHRNILEQKGLSHWFDVIDTLPEEHQSITGFKHNVYEYMAFERNLYLDSDMIWCRDPDRLWEFFAPYEFTITGNQVADVFFGAPKNIAILKDILFFRRHRTLKRMNISHLVRVQSGMMYASSPAKTREVCELAKEFLSRQNLTHFRSRKEEKGRSHESCEWSFALAMVKLNIQVFPWLNGYDSPQLDYIDAYTGHDSDFKQVECLLYANRFVYDLKGIRIKWLRKTLLSLFSLIPGKGDHYRVTPYTLHFGWVHQKEVFYRFADHIWLKALRTSQNSDEQPVSVSL